MPNKKSSDGETSVSFAGRSPSQVLLCTKGDCRRTRRDDFDALRDQLLEAGITPGEVGCQGSCEGPTAVVRVGDDLRWFERLQSGKARKGLVELATGATHEPTGALRKRELTGARRRKATKKFERQLS